MFSTDASVERVHGRSARVNVMLDRLQTIMVGDVPVAIERRGAGAPLLVLHDELGYAGWMSWQEQLAGTRTLHIPMQPGFGDTPRLDWIRSYGDLAAFYARMLREQDLGPIDVVGFSAGGFIAAEMAAACPSLFRKVVLVGPLGARPLYGEILDFFAMTVRAHMLATVNGEDNEYAQRFAGDLTPLQFERFEDARAETACLGWEPFMFSPSLPKRLEGVGVLPTLLVWGDQDRVCPRGCIDAYEQALPAAEVAVMPGVGHRPEVEDTQGFLSVLKDFLG
jgi:pimeloyl-ACP methyl ester carboxylesterase